MSAKTSILKALDEYNDSRVDGDLAAKKRKIKVDEKGKDEPKADWVRLSLEKLNVDIFWPLREDCLGRRTCVNCGYFWMESKGVPLCERCTKRLRGYDASESELRSYSQVLLSSKTLEDVAQMLFSPKYSPCRFGVHGDSSRKPVRSFCRECNRQLAPSWEAFICLASQEVRPVVFECSCCQREDVKDKALQDESAGKKMDADAKDESVTWFHGAIWYNNLKDPFCLYVGSHRLFWSSKPGVFCLFCGDDRSSESSGDTRICKRCVDGIVSLPYSVKEFYCEILGCAPFELEAGFLGSRSLADIGRAIFTPKHAPHVIRAHGLPIRKYVQSFCLNCNQQLWPSWQAFIDHATSPHLRLADVVSCAKCYPGYEDS